MWRILAGVLSSVAVIAVLTNSVSAQQAPAAPQTPPSVAQPVAHTKAQYLPEMRSLTLAHDAKRPDLAVPEGDFTAGIINEPIPQWYVTPPWFGVRHPVRTLYPFQHRPLYFEDSSAERCGVSAGCLQPGVSVARFTADLLLLPCRMCQQHPNECVTAGGDCPVCCAPPKNQSGRDNVAQAEPHRPATTPPQPVVATSKVRPSPDSISSHTAAKSGKAQLSPTNSAKAQLNSPKPVAATAGESANHLPAIPRPTDSSPQQNTKPSVLTGPVKSVSAPAVQDSHLNMPPDFARHPGKR